MKTKIIFSLMILTLMGCQQIPVVPASAVSALEQELIGTWHCTEIIINDHWSLGTYSTPNSSCVYDYTFLSEPIDPATIAIPPGPAYENMKKAISSCNTTGTGWSRPSVNTLYIYGMNWRIMSITSNRLEIASAASYGTPGYGSYVYIK